MYAQIEQLTSEPGPLPDHPQPPGSGPGQATRGRLGSIILREIDGPATTRITLYDEAPGPDSYHVIVAEQGTAAAEQPTHALVLHFDGPRAPEQAAAAEFAGRQRIWPAVRDISGLVGVWVLRGPEFASVECVLATSAQTLDAIAHAVMTSELLPGEDLALLPGPDRIQTHQVTGYAMDAASEPAPVAGQ